MALGSAARAQNAPTVIAPLQVAPDQNNVNLHNGRTQIEMPVLSVPGAPNLRFDRLQNAAPYITGRILTPTGSEHDERSYAVHIGAASSDAFDCYDYECIAVTGSGATFAWNQRLYQQAGSGAVWRFSRLAVATPSPNQSLAYYASEVTYPNGEAITFTYDTAAPGLPFNRVLHRPTRLTSNLGYFIEIKYQGTDPNTPQWEQVTEAAIYNSAAPTTPLGRLTYSGATITDLGGRVYSCQGCVNGLGMEIEVDAGSMQLPGETSSALAVTAQPGATVVASVTRDGVPWTYAYQNLRLQTGTLRYIFDRMTVTGPNGFHQFYDVANSYHSIRDIAAKRVHTTITRVTDSLNRATAYYYDPYDRPIRAVFPEQNEVSIVYDFNGNVIERTMRAKPGPPPLLEITERAFYPVGACANVLCYRPIWSKDGMGRQTDYAYDAMGQLTQQDDPADANGVRRRTIIEYAPSPGGISRRSAVTVCGVPLPGSGQANTCGTSAQIRTEYQYWHPTHPLRDTYLVQIERRIDGATGQMLDTTYDYDAAGRLRSTDGPLPGTDDATYARYDTYGRRTWEIGALAPIGLRIATRTQYRDSDDRVLYSETGTVTDVENPVLAVFRRTDLSYDGRRNPVREAVSASGTTYSVTDASYDDQGRLQCQARRMNPALFATPADPCVPGVEGMGVNAFGPDRITRNVYDAAGQRLQAREGVGTATEAAEATWAYNLNGQVTTVIDGNGNKAELRYDRHGRQDRWTFPSATAPGDRPVPFDDTTPATALATAGAVNPNDYEEYGYDAAGNRVSHRKRDGSTLTFSYDQLNRVLVKTVPERAGLTATHTRDVYYGYDVRNLQLYARFDSATGEGVTNSYDGFGRLASSTINLGGTSRALSYEWDAGGRRTRITHPDPGSGQAGVYFTATYDALGRQTWIHEQGVNGRVVAGYNPYGSLAGTSRSNATLTNYGYDGVQRPNAYYHDLGGTAADGLWTFARNPAGQIASATRENDAYAWTRHYAVNRPHTTNGLNQYARTGQANAAGSAQFSYDANGNLASEAIWNGTAYTVSATYTYDVENRLVGRSGGVTLAYDPLGRLFSVASPSTYTRFLYDGDALVAEYDGAGAMTRRYVHWTGADVPMLSYAGTDLTQLSQLHADERGSIIAATDAAGTATINAYDEYGIPAVANTGRFQYTGQIWIPELGMYHYKARIYSPTLGRFLQTDPIGYDDQINLYAYVGNDPVNMADPTGMCETGSRLGSSVQCREHFDYAQPGAAQGTGTARRYRLSETTRTVMRHPAVMRQFWTAFRLSNPDGPPSEKNEHGFWVTQLSRNNFRVGAIIRGSGPNIRYDHILLARPRGANIFIHIHPFRSSGDHPFVRSIAISTGDRRIAFDFRSLVISIARREPYDGYNLYIDETDYRR